MKAGTKETSFWGALALYPPYYVRLLAKVGPTKAATDADIAIASGIDLARVRAINQMTSWDDLKVSELLRYTAACNFDPTLAKDRHRVQVYERKCTKDKIPPFGYLRRSPRFEAEILPLLKLLWNRMNEASRASAA